MAQFIQAVKIPDEEAGYDPGNAPKTVIAELVSVDQVIRINESGHKSAEECAKSTQQNERWWEGSRPRSKKPRARPADRSGLTQPAHAPTNSEAR